MLRNVLFQFAFKPIPLSAALRCSSAYWSTLSSLLAGLRGLGSNACWKYSFECNVESYHYANTPAPFSSIVTPRGHQARCPRRLAFLFFLLGLAFSQACLAAEDAFEVFPKWVRPGPEAIVRVKFSEKVDVSKRLFLRLTLPNSAVKDLPLAGEQVRRRVAEINIPSPLRRGTYKTELVNEEGEVLAAGPENFRVSSSEKPTISTILPKVIYPKAGGKFDFEIIGDNFSQYNAKDIDVRINDISIDIPQAQRLDDRRGALSDTDCQGLRPCLIWNWRTIRIFGVSLDNNSFSRQLDNHPFDRPLEISVEVDQLVSDPKPIMLSCVQRYTPMLMAFMVLASVIALVYYLSIRKIVHHQTSGSKLTALTYLFTDPQTNTYSLSKLQMIIWAAAAIISYSYLAASQFFVQWKLGIPAVPEGLPMLLGISATTTALAVSATEFRGSKGAGAVPPGLGDFITTGGVVAPERLQFFIWTILGAIGFVAATLAQDPGTVSKMAEIPESFNQLMGASSLGYLAGKFARKPGPVIKSLALDLANGIRIVGENLSPQAQITLKGVRLSNDQILPAPGQPEGSEFVSELLVMPKNMVAELQEIAPVKVKNPDGQHAEWNGNTHPADSTNRVLSVIA